LEIILGQERSGGLAQSDCLHAVTRILFNVIPNNQTVEERAKRSKFQIHRSGRDNLKSSALVEVDVSWGDVCQGAIGEELVELAEGISVYIDCTPGEICGRKGEELGLRVVEQDALWASIIVYLFQEELVGSAFIPSLERSPDSLAVFEKDDVVSTVAVANEGCHRTSRTCGKMF